MALSEAMVETYFTAARPLQVGLASGGVELGDAGYTRSAVDSWVHDGATVMARAAFGPFTGPVTFDGALLFDGGRLVETVPVEGPVSLPPGSSWTQEIRVAVAGL